MSCSKPKCQHVDRMLKEKLQILNKLECGVKTIDVCKEFNLSQSTLSMWKKRKTKLKDMVDAGKSLIQREIVNHFYLMSRGPYTFGLVK